MYTYKIDKYSETIGEKKILEV